ncbi:unnamed protein product [Prorocentrum cordatum]|uniref:Protein xylosyltransferase n=1 Tax=Prorocentrum cordatum TaxID=2364126 RepID=A0ABN9SJR8_9DINO|nr:unnamed protein product [Polarella glacialis]
MVTASAKESSEQESFQIDENADDNSITLQTTWGKFLTAVRLGAAAKVVLRSDREAVGSWATFILRAKQLEGRGLLLGSDWLGNTVTLQSYLGTYVGVGVEGEVTVNVQEKDVGNCEGFKLVDSGDDGMALQTCKGTFLGARSDGKVVAEAMEAGESEHFRIETIDSKTFFSVLDLPVKKTGNLTDGSSKLSKLDHKTPQPVALKSIHGGYLFPLEEAKRVSDEVVPSNSTRVTQAVLFTRSCEDSGLLPISGRKECEAAASSIGLVEAEADVDVEIVEDAGVPEGCYVENQTHFRLGANPGNQGTGVVHREDGTVMNPICAGVCPSCAMPEPTAPALVILFYERDLCKMRLLASSLTKHDPNQLIGTVHLIWLSKHSPNEFMGDIDYIRNAAAASHTVRFHDMSWMFGSGMAGWHVQQIVKLKASGLVQEDYYVVFDAKNAFIRDMKPDTFLTPCYQGKVFADTDFDNLNADAKKWYYASAAVLGVDVPWGRKWSASITPVVMHTQTVIDMLHYLNEDHFHMTRARCPCAAARSAGTSRPTAPPSSPCITSTPPPRRTRSASTGNRCTTQRSPCGGGRSS